MDTAPGVISRHGLRRCFLENSAEALVNMRQREHGVSPVTECTELAFLVGNQLPYDGKHHAEGFRRAANPSILSGAT